MEERRTRYGEYGYPQGTICRVKCDARVVPAMQGKHICICKTLHWSDQFGYDGYYATMADNSVPDWWFVRPWMLELVQYPITLHNWCSNKVLLLLEPHSYIAQQLAQERENGEYPDY